MALPASRSTYYYRIKVSSIRSWVCLCGSEPGTPGQRQGRRWRRHHHPAPVARRFRDCCCSMHASARRRRLSGKRTSASGRPRAGCRSPPKYARLPADSARIQARHTPGCHWRQPPAPVLGDGRGDVGLWDRMQYALGQPDPLRAVEERARPLAHPVGCMHYHRHRRA